MPQLITPHGGELVDLLASPERAAELRKQARDLPSWTLSSRQLCDLEMLACGSFSPLCGFMDRATTQSVMDTLHLPEGTLWPIPVTLDVTAEVAATLEVDGLLVLRNEEGLPLAVLHVAEVWEHEREAEALAVYGTSDRSHPGVAHLLERTHEMCVGGRVEALRLPPHYDFSQLRQTPTEVREQFAAAGWDRVVAFQTRNPMHRAHYELTRRAAEENGAKLLIQPVVGMTKPGDLDHYTRVRCYRALLGRYPEGLASLSLLPLAMRMAGPREALLHAIVRKNYGCTHFIVGRDHAGPGNDSSGKPFYGPYEAQEAMRAHRDELGIELVPFKMVSYVAAEGRYRPADEIAPGTETLQISGTQLRERFTMGQEIPEWFTFPEVARELRRTHPSRDKAGFTVFFTGLSGSGKSTVANVLLVKFLELGGRPVTLLDGDIVRTELSSELGFSKEHRDLNVRRIGFVASEITKNGGVAICAPIAPYLATRQRVRETIAPLGGFVLVHVATPLEVCERRDVKGLYAKARAGIIKEFTGISDPYEVPTDAEVVLDTSKLSPEQAAEVVLSRLREDGYL
ncbi:MAG: bifunctional sulfate adenylyltransferase/adenylylsulfate kinase [Thermoanaerobaculia bacterium]|nr:bifunctional sulfate adenylyltransferase/adenylylsulfate kinase [Thermoanaerobaculia bacterium]